jgi:hypothetical protein
VNSAYKHLDSKLKIAELTIGQWLGLSSGVAIAIIWGFYLSPFGMFLTAGTAVYLGAIPAGLAFMSAFYDVDLWIVMRAAVTWSRLDGKFMPGAGGSVEGYVVRDEPGDENDSSATLSTLDLRALWES